MARSTCIPETLGDSSSRGAPPFPSQDSLAAWHMHAHALSLHILTSACHVPLSCHMERLPCAYPHGNDSNCVCEVI